MTKQSAVGWASRMDQRIQGPERIVNINTAPESVLVGFTAVGPARIQALVQRRPFQNWDEVQQVPGISESIVDRLKRCGATLV